MYTAVLSNIFDTVGKIKINLQATSCTSKLEGTIYWTLFTAL